MPGEVERLLVVLSDALLDVLRGLDLPATLPAMEPRLAALCAAVAVVAWPQRPFFLSRSRSGPATRTRSPLATTAGHRRTRAGAGSGSAELAEALVPCLAAGLPPASALAVAAGSMAPDSRVALCARSAAEEAARGVPVGPGLQREAVAARDQDLAHLARAWQLSESLGAPLADAVASSARVARQRQAAARRLGAATAGARTSMGVLALLPAAGPLAGLMLGVSPVRLFASRLSAVSAAIGLALALLGWVWARALVRRAAQPKAL